jgi:hypothetical protein
LAVALVTALINNSDQIIGSYIDELQQRRPKILAERT